MKPNVRKLSIGMKGEDVKLLHEALEEFGTRIPPDEKKKKYFGSGTYKAVLEFQNKHDIEGTGIVDETTFDKFYEFLGKNRALNISGKYVTGADISTIEDGLILLEAKNVMVIEN